MILRKAFKLYPNYDRVVKGSTVCLVQQSSD